MTPLTVTPTRACLGVSCLLLPPCSMPSSPLTPTLLMLTETALFYHDFSSVNTNKVTFGTFRNWASAVPANPSSERSRVSRRPVSSRTAVSRGGSRSTVPSSNTISVSVTELPKKKMASASASCRKEGAMDVFNDESLERAAAISSPVKGAKRLTDNVCFLL